MKTLTTLALVALVSAGAAVATTAPASAGVSFSVGFGGPAYYGYDYYRPCRYYFQRDLPAPRRCYDEYRGYYPSAYMTDGFVFRDRGTYDRRWHDRDDFRHWRTHNWDRDHYRYHGHHDHDRHY